MQLHDGNVPIAVSHPADAISRYFVRGVGIAEGTGDVIAEIIGTDGGNAKAVFYMSNHRGDTLATYRGDKTTVAKYRYDAFGNERTAYCVVNEPENAPRYTFSTKEYLADAVLYLYAYRVYDPVAGRWTQRDPIDYEDSLNLYQFCGNNPVNGLDMDGRFTYPEIAAGLLLVVGVTLFSVEAYKFHAKFESLNGTAHGMKTYAITITGTKKRWDGTNYSSLSLKGRAVVDAHEDVHSGWGGDKAAYKVQYELAKEQIQLFYGNLTDKERTDMWELHDAAKAELKKCMGEKELSAFEKQVQNRIDKKSKELSKKGE
jgi:RHS repeat-associated protein